MFRYRLLWVTCMTFLVIESKLLLDVPQAVAVAGRQLTISCIFTQPVKLLVVNIVRVSPGNVTTIFGIQYNAKRCKGGGSVCNQSCTYNCHERNLSWIINSLPEDWHDTEWKCSHGGGVTPESDVYKLNISVPISKVTISPDSKAVIDIGNVLLATCVTSPSSRPASKITWIKERNAERIDISENSSSKIIQSENEDKEITESTLSYRPVKSDNGDYIFCTANDGIGINKQSNKTQVVVQYIPTENIYLTTPSAIYQGDNIEITCSIRGGNPLANIFFSCGKVNSQSNTYSDTASRKITLLDINKNYNGTTCFCSATHVARTSFKKETNITLNVLYPPEVNIVSKQEPIENSRSFSLQCVADGNPKLCTYYNWQHFYDDVLVRELTADSLLKFDHALSFQDSGTYICRASNNVTDKNNTEIQSTSTTVLVKAGPKFIPTKQNVITGEENSSLHIGVEFLAFPKTFDTTWTNADGKISNTSRTTTATHSCPVRMEIYGIEVLVTKYGYKSWLNITSFQSNDLGNYSLIVANNIRQAKYSFRTKFSGPPDNPKSFKFDDITSNSIDLSWIAGENNGHNQSFNVTYKGGGIKPKVILVKEDVTKSLYHLSVHNLSPSTLYEVSLLAWNKKGKSPNVLTETITTKKSELNGTYDTSVAAIGAGCAIGIIVAFLLGINVYRRKKGRQKDDNRDNMREHYPYLNPVENEDDPVDMVPYEPAEPYDNPLYDVVNTPTGNKLNAQNVSAEINGIKKDGTGVQSNNELQKGLDLNICDSAYENVGAVGGVADEEDKELNEAFLRNKRCPQLKPKPSRRKNKDGLIYVDLAILGSENNHGKGVIHGIENRNNYAEVDFNRHADPLPSDVDVYDDDNEQS